MTASMTAGKIRIVCFASGLALVLAAPILVLAQSPIRLGILVQEMERSQAQAIKGLGEELKRLGYQEKKNLFFETRNAKGNRAALQPAAGEILSRHVNAIFTTGTSATRAAIASTGEVPIVFVHPDDPVGAGFIKSSGERPKNLTGVAAYARSTTEKRVELIKEIRPRTPKNPDFLRWQQCFFTRQLRRRRGSSKEIQPRGSWLCHQVQRRVENNSG